jgi:hypothetical protein
VLSRFSASSLQLPMPASSSFAPRRSTEDFSQSQLTLLPTATQSRTSLPANNSATGVQQAYATTLHPSPANSVDSIHRQVLPATNSPPSFHTALPWPTQPPDNKSPWLSTLPPKSPTPDQPIISIKTPLPGKTSQDLSSQQFSTINSPGPVDPYELWAEPATSQPNLDFIAEIMGDLLVRPLTAVPSDIHPWESQSIDSFKELTSNIRTRNPNLHFPSEMPADSTPHDSMPSCAPQVPEKVQLQPRSEEMPSQTFTFSQVPQALDSFTSSLLTSRTSAPQKARSFSEGTST